MKKYNEKGMVLVLVLVVMVVLSILGLALLSISSASAKMIAYQNKSKQAYYLAKSGADAIATYLINNSKDDTLLLALKISDYSSIDTSSKKLNVKVENGSSNQLRITGIGNVADIEKSTTVIIRRLTVGELLNKAIYTNATIDITGMLVEGDIQSGGDISIKKAGNRKYDLSLYKPLDNVPIFMDMVTPPTSDTPLYFPQKLTVDTTQRIFNSCKLEEILINNGGTLEIVANNNIDIVVDRVIGKGNITIEGEGRVNLYVIDLFDIQTNGNINNNDPNALYIYMQENSTFNLQAGIEVYAYIIAPDAKAVIQSDKSSIYGSLIADELVGNGGAVYFVKPSNTSEIDESLKAYKILRWEE